MGKIGLGLIIVVAIALGTVFAIIIGQAIY